VTDQESPPARVPVRIDFEISSDAHHCWPVGKAGTAAFGLFMLCGCWSARSEQPGHVPESIAAKYGDAEWDQYVMRLVAAGMWKPVEGGWQMVPVPIPFKPLYRFRPVYRRDPIPAHLRDAVMERDGHACVLCGATEDLTLDHIRPWSLGGPDTYSNLRVLCRSCNSSKGARV